MVLWTEFNTEETGSNKPQKWQVRTWLPQHFRALGSCISAKEDRRSFVDSRSLYMPHLHQKSKLGKTLAALPLSCSLIFSRNDHLQKGYRWKSLHFSAGAQRGKSRELNLKAEPLLQGRFFFGGGVGRGTCYGQKILAFSHLIFYNLESPKKIKTTWFPVFWTSVRSLFLHKLLQRTHSQTWG